jgi:hypothetical protein
LGAPEDNSDFQPEKSDDKENPISKKIKSAHSKGELRTAVMVKRKDQPTVDLNTYVKL